MAEIGIILIAVVTFGYAMIANRLAQSVITAPMIFLVLGYVLSLTGWFPTEGAEEALYLVAEITLVVLLFLDAAQIDLNSLRRDHVWPQRMLLIGLPLAMLIGTVAGWLIFPQLPIFALALIAALLAPTDAALGQAIANNKAIPARIRRGLTVESGLNDGLALPAILLFASLAAAMTTGEERDWLSFAAAQIILGPLAGGIVGYLGGKAVLLANEHSWTSELFEGVAALSLAGLAYLLAVSIGGNGFIAAFAAGLALGHVLTGRCRFLFEFTEGEGQLLMWGAFLMFGLVLMPQALPLLSWPIFALILLSLFVVRPLAIWLSLIGTDAAPATRAFFGWFGPRGLATVLFALLVVPGFDPEFGSMVLAIAVNAVWISALLHGVTAAPLGSLYAKKVAAMDECPEMRPVAMPFDGEHANPVE